MMVKIKIRGRNLLKNAKPQPPPPEGPERISLVLFFAVLFFLCSADQFFAIRVHGLNFRLGQALLLFCSILSLRQIAGGIRNGSGEWRGLWKIAKNWVPFFLVYALAAGTSPSPGRTFLKEGWALFNIGGALLLFSNPGWTLSLRKGIFWGATALALTIWIQVVAIYLLGVTVVWPYPSASQPLSVTWLHGFPLGFAQNTQDSFGGVPILRPNAFYYEPSYAGCALAFALPLVLAIGKNGGFFGSAFAPAMVLSSVVLTSSRAGILGLGLGLGAGFIGSLFLGPKGLFTSLLKPTLLAALFLAIALLSPSVQKYAGFLLGPLGPSAIAARVNDPRLSEGGRVESFRKGLRSWGENPVLGSGSSAAAENHSGGLGVVSENMWLEIGIESGVLGFLAFAFALGRTVVEAAKRGANQAVMLLALSAIAVHLVVNMNFTMTFPRLDYWILFFLAISLMARPATLGKPRRGKASSL